MQRIAALILLCAAFLTYGSAAAKKITLNDGKYMYQLDTSTKKATFLQLTNPFDPCWSSKVEIVDLLLYEDGNTYTVNKIGKHAFLSCPAKKIILPSTITAIGESAFEQCPNLTTLEIPSEVTTIGSNCFAFSNIRTITIPSSVTVIGQGAFYGSELRTITFQKPSKSGLILRAQVFYGCKYLKSLAIPAGTTSIGNMLCYQCSNLTSLTLPSGITTLPERMIIECYALKSLAIPSTVTTINEYSLAYSGLASINIPESVKTLGKGFLQSTAIQTVSLPKGITAVPDEAFYDCTALKSVTLHAGIRSLGDLAFYNCPSLMSITSQNTVPPTFGLNVFSNATYEGATLALPAAAVDKYRVAPGWKDFRWLKMSGIDDIETDAADAGNEPMAKEYYRLDGTKVNVSEADMLPAGIYICRQGKKTSKLLIH